MRIIDFHTHAFPDELAEKAIGRLHERSGDYRAYHDGTVSGLLGSMDRAGIEQAVIASIATRPEQVPNITDWSIRIRSERIIPFASIHPDFRDFAEELDRIKDAGLRGIKLHPMYQEFVLDDPALLPLYRAIADRDLVCLFHAGWDIAFPDNDQASPRRILHVHEAVPTLKIVASHLGGWHVWDEVAELLLGRPIYLETSFAIREAEASVFRRIIENHSPDYFLFGSDSPWQNQKEELDGWKSLDISESFKEKIFFKNASRLLGEEL
ncbi:MAG: amidohydrolase family protein [Candidatus Euphemobacter frigidus]|nr:amidohydrolase family protein [Candidatus Euphemobacter frigidus]MDP8276436.1 amidohydrolase family protein [Candidatus Euphemobacter frigidus]